jgi:Mg-chelatase subunit ChlD
METRQKVFNLIILDESGSMETIKSATIKGFNEVVQTIKAIEKQFSEQEHFISFITFNGAGITTRILMEPVNHLKEIDAKHYHPVASTPLYDAMGYCINNLSTITNMIQGSKVLVTILTDGEENASRNFNGKSIKQLVEQMKEKGWTFNYIGANHDVEEFALNISIHNSMKFEANDTDMRDMFEKEKQARYNYCQKLRDKEDTNKNYYKK